MIDISSSSFDPMIRYTVPVAIPAAEAIGRPAVCSIWIRRVSGLLMIGRSSAPLLSCLSLG
jgi:hypothetical protein